MGISGQPVAEKTCFGWIILSPGHEDNTNPMLLTQSTSVDFEQLCCLDDADSLTQQQTIKMWFVTSLKNS